MMGVWILLRGGSDILINIIAMHGAINIQQIILNYNQLNYVGIKYTQSKTDFLKCYVQLSEVQCRVQV